ncbi:Hypothetical predicted protein [Mytilus galloprovincialis]|uniref:Uncharacterized protein n=1 Tax=Mytilus galloprovincialis TaxID=29158 RepID=A0A8B6H9H3_MYTGA|nr:Hypothetical predicted protein [Mytilus galloprovincialis]
MNNSNMEINNPIYRQPGDGEIEGQGSEIKPLDIEGGDHSSNRTIIEKFELLHERYAIDRILKSVAFDEDGLMQNH